MTKETEDSRVQELRKKISLLEWDLGMIANRELRQKREAQLERLRSELKGLQNTG